MPVVGDAREALLELTPMLADWSGSEDWVDRAARETSAYNNYIDKIAAPVEGGTPTYAQVVGVVDRNALPSDYCVSAAGGLPGELNSGWRAKGVDSFDCEYGFSCMGYEISGAWGAKMAMPDREVIVFVGDGSYMMMNSDLYSSVLTGHKLIVIVCDNGGFAVIHRLQVNQGGAGYNNLLSDTRHTELPEIDFAGHARAMGCEAETVTTVAEFEAAFERARAADRTYVIAVKTTQFDWTEGGIFWEVGVPEVSGRQEVLDAHQRMESGKQAQRLV
jgi:3D-(3,5/4)-trihydroxycyclohexane-1,2-dione acylhydrolase (decyclizing)